MQQNNNIMQTLNLYKQNSWNNDQAANNQGRSMASTPLRKSTVELSPFTLLDSEQVHFKVQNDNNKIRKVHSEQEDAGKQPQRNVALLAETKKKIFKNKTCCLTAGVVLWLRRERRRLRGEEMLRLQGFWPQGRTRLLTFSDVLLKDLAANAVNAGAFLACLLAALQVVEFSSS